MAHAVKEAVQEKIDIIDQLDDMYAKKNPKYWLLIPATLAVAAATGAFVWVRRVRKHKEA